MMAIISENAKKIKIQESKRREEKEIRTLLIKTLKDFNVFFKNITDIKQELKKLKTY